MGASQPRVLSPDEAMGYSPEPQTGQRVLSVDEAMNANPDGTTTAPFRESFAATETAGGASMMKFGIGAVAGVAQAMEKGYNAVSDRIKGHVDIGHIDTSGFQDAMFSTMDEVDQMAKKFALKEGQKPSTAGAVAGGAVTIPEVMASWPQHGIDVANEMFSKGASTAEVAKAVAPIVGFDAAMQILPLHLTGAAAVKAGLGPVAAQVAGRGAAAGLNIGLGAAERATENATLPDRPEFKGMQQDIAPSVAEAVSEAGIGLLAGGPGAHAAPRVRPVEELRGALGEAAPVPETVPGGEPGVNYDVPPTERGPTGLAKRGISVEEAPEAAPAPKTWETHRIEPEGDFIDRRPEAPPPKGGIRVEPIKPEEVTAAPMPADEEITAAPAPKEEAPSITKSDRQVELERLRGLAVDPGAQKLLDSQIKSEAAKSQKAYDAQQKDIADAKAAREMRVLASNTQDPDIAKSLLAKAEKLAPVADQLPLETPPSPVAEMRPVEGAPGGIERRSEPRPVTGSRPLQPGEEPTITANKSPEGMALSPYDPAFAGDDTRGKFWAELTPEQQQARIDQFNRERQAQQAAGQEPAAQQHTIGTSPFFRRISDELGGIHSDAKADAGVDETRGQGTIFLGGRRPDGSGRGRLFHKGGVGIDRLTEWLQQNKYLSDHDVETANDERPGGAHELAHDLIHQELREPGSVHPITDQADRFEALANVHARNTMLDEADRLGIHTEGRTDEQIQHDIWKVQDQLHAGEHGHEVDHLEHLPDIHRAAQIDPDAVERAAIQHEYDLPAFHAAVKEILDAHDRTAAGGERAGAESGPSGEAAKPEVRPEPEGGPAVQDRGDALRNEQGAGAAGRGERPEAGSEVQPAGPHGGGEAAAESGKPVEPPDRDILTNPTPDELRAKADLEKRAAAEKAKKEKAPPPEDFTLTGSDREADQAAAAGQQSLFLKMGDLPKAIQQRLGRLMEVHTKALRDYLDSKGLGWVHRDTVFGVDDTIKGAALATFRDGKYHILLHPDTLGLDPNQVKHAMLHEAGHVADLSGYVYSQHPDMNVGKTLNGGWKPMGAVAKEIFNLANHPDFKEMLRYPLDHEFASKMDEDGIRAEMFAQMFAAHNNPRLLEVMEREAPKTAKFMADATEHAGGNAKAPSRGEFVDQASRRRLDFKRNLDASRSNGGIQREAPAVRVQRGDREPLIPDRRIETPEDRQKESKTIRDILTKNFSPKQLRRMAQAGLEEDAKLASGLPDRTKGYESLPAEQREVMEFLAGRGYTPTMVDKLMGTTYRPYVSMERPESGGGGGIKDALQKVFAPASRGDIAAKQAGIMRANYGEMAREREVAFEKLQGVAKQFDKMPVADNVKFIDAMERGTALSDPKMAEQAKALRTFLDDKRDQVQATGTGALENFDENYFPHVWKEHGEAQKLFGRRPLEGSKAFLKARTIPYTTDGLRWRAYDADGEFVKSYDSKEEAEANTPEGGRVGKPLTPITSNPVELALLKGREMDRFIYGQKIFQEMKGADLARLVPHGEKAPDGFTRINDKIANGGKDGVYYAPDEAATLINNHLSPGLQGNAFYDAWRGIGTLLNGAQLGLSAFHVGFTTMDTMVSKVALGVKQMARGDLVKGIGNVAQGFNPAQPVMNIVKGDRLLRAYLGELDSPEMAPIVDAIQQAGGRVRMDDFYRNAAVNAFTQALRRRDALGMAKSFLPSLLDRLNAPIFEHLVPRQKLGVFFDMAKDWLQNNPDAGVDEKRAALGKMWDSVDNRMGQLVYDNVFWNRALKDGLMSTVRSVGWNLGTFRELGGGAMDLKNVFKDRGLSDRSAYVVALPLLAGIYGAITQQIYGAQAGKSVDESLPESAKDLYFPRTFRQRPDGSDDRVSLPTYMKDVYAYAKDARNFVKYGEDPTQTLRNKANPAISTVSEMLQNQDFYGAAIRNPADPLVRQLEDEAQFLLKSIEPFSVRNFQQQQAEQGKEGSAIKNPLGYLASPSMYGITPAPGYVAKSDEQVESSQVSRLRQPLMAKFREELQAGGDINDILPRMERAGLTKSDIRYVERSAGGTTRHRLKAFQPNP